MTFTSEVRATSLGKRDVILHLRATSCVIYQAAYLFS